MVRTIDVKPLDFDCSLAHDNRRRCIESQLRVGDHGIADFGDPRFTAAVTNFAELQSCTVISCAMLLHIAGGIRCSECSTEGAFCERRKRQRVGVLRSPDPNGGWHGQHHPILGATVTVRRDRWVGSHVALRPREPRRGGSIRLSFGVSVGQRDGAGFQDGLQVRDDLGPAAGHRDDELRGIALDGVGDG